jgi:hypothetical protein
MDGRGYGKKGGVVTLPELNYGNWGLMRILLMKTLFADYDYRLASCEDWLAE